MARRKNVLINKPEPGRDGKYEEGGRLVPDAFNPGKLFMATVNVCESAIDHMAARGRLNAAQVAAGNRFRRLWELAAVGHVRGINLEACGRSIGAVGDPLTDDLVYAGRVLNNLFRHPAMDKIRSQILISIVGEGKLIE